MAASAKDKAEFPEARPGSVRGTRDGLNEQADGRAAARPHINDLAFEADSDGSEFADREAAKAAIRKAVK
jgi:hypothetical protein